MPLECMPTPRARLGREQRNANQCLAAQEALAAHFARGAPPIAMWHGIEWRAGAVAPLLDAACGWLECRLVAEHAVGDHTFFVGEVLSLEQGPAPTSLVYVNREYRAL